MHEFPQNWPTVRQKWVKFAQFKRADFDAAPQSCPLILCSKHFAECNFVNFMAEYQWGLLQRGICRAVLRVTNLEKIPVRISKDEADEQQVHSMIPKIERWLSAKRCAWKEDTVGQKKSMKVKRSTFLECILIGNHHFKVEDNDFISFWENKLWKMRSVLCRMSGIATQKYYCMTGRLLFLFPATLDRLRMSSQVFSNTFIAVWLLTKILTCTVCRNTWHLT